MMMLKQAGSMAAKASLPPGALVPVGRPSEGRTRVSLIEYDQDGVRAAAEVSLEELRGFRDRPGVVWIKVEGLAEVEVLREIGEICGLHPLVLEDILNAHQRPKLEDYGEYLFVVLKVICFEPEAAQFQSVQVSLVLGRGFVVSFEEGAGDIFAPVAERIEKGHGRIRHMGADYLAYALIDTVVDSYFGVLEAVADRTASVEENLLADMDKPTLPLIHQLKRYSLEMNRIVWPVRDVVNLLLHRESELVGQEIMPFLRDVHEHTIQVIETAELNRDILSGLLDVALTNISTRLNEVMKVLTIIATLFIPLTFIAGIYGMNFRYMPELGWRWGYPVLLVLMAALALGMLAYFRRRKWL